MSLSVRQIVHVQRVFGANIASSAAIATRRALGLWNSHVIGSFVFKRHVQRQFVKHLIQIFDVYMTEPLFHTIHLVKVGVVIGIRVRFQHVRYMLLVSVHEVIHVVSELFGPHRVLKHCGVTVECYIGVYQGAPSETAPLYHTEIFPNKELV